MTQSQSNVSRIRADELTEGDIILHLNQPLEVYTEPKYTLRGIVFDVLPLGLKTEETYQVCFDPRWTFDLVGYQSKEVA